MITQPHSDAVAVPRWRFPFWGVLAALLICPLVVMGFTNEVRWDLADFVAAAALLTSFGIAVEAAFFLNAEVQHPSCGYRCRSYNGLTDLGACRSRDILRKRRLFESAPGTNFDLKTCGHVRSRSTMFAMTDATPNVPVVSTSARRETVLRGRLPENM